MPKIINFWMEKAPMVFLIVAAFLFVVGLMLFVFWTQQVSVHTILMFNHDPHSRKGKAYRNVHHIAGFHSSLCTRISDSGFSPRHEEHRVRVTSTDQT